MRARQFLSLTLLSLTCGSALPATSSVAVSTALPSITPIIRTSKTLSGQPLALPSGASEVVATRADFPANAKTNVHRHPFARLVYVEQGRLSVTNFDSGTTTVAAAGEMFVEAIGQWHQGTALDGKPVRLLVIDLVPQGLVNAESRD